MKKGLREIVTAFLLVARSRTNLGELCLGGVPGLTELLLTNCNLAQISPCDRDNHLMEYEAILIPNPKHIQEPEFIPHVQPLLGM